MQLSNNHNAIYYILKDSSVLMRKQESLRKYTEMFVLGNIAHT